MAETNIAEETLANTVDNNAPIVAAEEAPLTDAEGKVVPETVAKEVATETEEEMTADDAGAPEEEVVATEEETVA